MSADEAVAAVAQWSAMRSTPSPGALSQGGAPAPSRPVQVPSLPSLVALMHC